MFDVERFLGDYNIDFITEGPNTSENFLNIHCPFPGCDDHGYHFGIAKNGMGASCWKCGKKSIFATLKLLAPDTSPQQIVKQYRPGYQLLLKLNNNERKLKEIPKKVILPGQNLTKLHKNYLKQRGFSPDYLIHKYKITGTGPLGAYRLRVVVPFFYNKKLVSYQGRDITNQSEQRYKACSKPKEIVHHKHILYNFDNCQKDWCIVTEGFMKVWKLGDNTCATLGRIFTEQQVLLLSCFKVVFIYFDPDSAGRDGSQKLSLLLDSLGVVSFIISAEKAADNLTQDESKLFMKKVKKTYKNLLT